MAEQATANATATPPATSGGLSAADVQKIIGETVGAAIANALKPVTETIATLSKNHDALAASLKNVPTTETLGKAIGDQLAAREATASQAKARADFIGTKLKDLPAAYTDKLGADPAKFEEEAKTIRDTFQKDLAAMGVKPAAVSSDSGATGAATTTADKVDTGKLSGIQLIELAVKQSQAVPASHSAGAAVATVGNAGAVKADAAAK